jgi:hypothetical protein
MKKIFGRRLTRMTRIKTEINFNLDKSLFILVRVIGVYPRPHTWFFGKGEERCMKKNGPS